VIREYHKWRTYFKKRVLSGSPWREGKNRGYIQNTGLRCHNCPTRHGTSTGKAGTQLPSPKWWLPVSPATNKVFSSLFLPASQKRPGYFQRVHS
jgi:hypothetical protein